MMNNRQLLCTFTTQNYIITTMRSILASFDIMYDRVYVFEYKNDKDNLLYTYNIKNVKPNMPFISNTISIHRKKQSNTFYTINALNLLITDINNGVLDKTYKLNWENYQDMAILTNNDDLRKISLNLNFLVIFLVFIYFLPKFIIFYCSKI